MDIAIKSNKQENWVGVIWLSLVMSGNFVQRGEPAIIDKWKRAKAAIENGVDLVIELPYFYATQSASKFAYGAVELLKIAKVDYILIWLVSVRI